MSKQYINRINGTPIQDTELTKIVNDNLPHYNEILMFEISGETDYTSLLVNSYFNVNALNIDETKSYIGKVKDINEGGEEGEENTFEFIYDKEADALIDEYNSLYIYNHKSYNGTDFYRRYE